MATPRKRWTIIENSLLREPWARETKLTMALLAVCMSDRWAADLLTAEQGTRALLSPGDLTSITGFTDQAKAISALKAVGKLVTLKLRQQANGFVHVHWPKLAKTQRWPARPPAEAGADLGQDEPGDFPATSPSSSSSSSRTFKKEKSPAPDGAPAESESEGHEIGEQARILARGFLDSRAVPLPKAKPPSPSAYRTWELEMDRLLRLDGRTSEQVIDLVRWLYEPGPRASPDALFWRPNVLSVPKLREKWDQLEACRTRGKTNGKQTVTDAAENVIRRFGDFAAGRTG